MVLEEGFPRKQVCEETGVGMSSLLNWVSAYRKDGEIALADKRRGRKVAKLPESESAQWWGSMAWAIIYGLTFATVLTLIVVPVMLRLNYKWFGTAGTLPVSE